MAKGESLPFASFWFEWVLQWHRALFFPLYYGLGFERQALEDISFRGWGFDALNGTDEEEAVAGAEAILRGDAP